MYRIILGFLLLNGMLFAAPQRKSNAQKSKITVLSTIERQQAINACKNFLSEEVVVFNDKDLFIFVPQKLDQKVDVQPEIPKSEIPTKRETKTEAEKVLRAVGTALKPQGHIFRQNRYVLGLNGARLLKEGDSLEASYKGKIFIIRVVKITKEQFTLQLNEQAITFNY